MSQPFRVLPSGERAVLLELDDLDAVRRHYAALVADPWPELLDAVPAARTILLITPGPAELARLVARLPGLRPQQHRPAANRSVEVPVRYDGADLAEVADQLSCSVEAVVERHRAAMWTVDFCGFAPGFGYLTSPDWPWPVARRPAPREAVPAGSVGLADAFSGVYPRSSPGGWQLIGRTAAALVTPDTDPPVLLAPGTAVRFVAEGR